MDTFRPGPDTARDYRAALGTFGTGVTVVTCFEDGKPLAMTANSFASVSLDPPLVLWSPQIASSRHDTFVSVHRFSIHVLGIDQLALAQTFARDGRDFSRVIWEAGDSPTLPGVVARFDCTHHAAHGAGDHTVVLGQVERVLRGKGTPLMFSAGAYGRFVEQDFTCGP